MISRCCTEPIHHDFQCPVEKIQRCFFFISMVENDNISQALPSMKDTCQRHIASLWTNSCKPNPFAIRTEGINVSLCQQPFPTPLMLQWKAETRLPNSQREYSKIWCKHLITTKNFCLFFCYPIFPFAWLYSLYICLIWGFLERSSRCETWFQMEARIISPRGACGNN